MQNVFFILMVCPPKKCYYTPGKYKVKPKGANCPVFRTKDMPEVGTGIAFDWTAY
jgi:hypothetical protein